MAALSAQLRKSVAGFRLPDYGGGTTTVGGSSSPRLPVAKEPANTAVANAAAAGTVTAGAPATPTAGSPSADVAPGAKMRKASGFGG